MRGRERGESRGKSRGKGGREQARLTGMIEWFLYLVLELLPVPIPHGRILQILNQRHRAFEGIDTFLQRVTHCPVNFVLREGGKGGREIESRGMKMEEY